jgi:hypothetical protein
MKAKIVSTITIKQEWLDEVKELLPEIEFEVVRTTKTIQTFYNTKLKSNYGVFQDLRNIVNAPTGYRYRVYVISDRKRRELGMVDHRAAYDNVDRDGVLDFYMGVDNKPDTKAIKNGFRSDFARLFIHEALHGKEQEIGREYLAGDRVHDMEAQGRLKELLKEHYTKGSMLTRLLNFKVRLVEVLSKKKSSLIHPIPKPYRISQAYGVPNKLYSATKHHIGTDYAIPVGTPIYAPCDGSIEAAGHTLTLGYFLHYRLPNHIMRVLHLRDLPKHGSYKQGDIIGYSGNTGLSSGPHAHVDLFINKVNLEGINASNFRERTVDPEVFYVTH